MADSRISRRSSSQTGSSVKNRTDFLSNILRNIFSFVGGAIRIASYAAGFCISRQEVCEALIDRASLETYIQRNEPDLLGL